MAKTQNLGVVSVVPMGKWMANQQYTELCIVRNQGASYLCYNANVNIQPGVTIGWEGYWMLLNQDVQFNDWTEANKKAIVNAVMEALPNGDEVSY